MSLQQILLSALACSCLVLFAACTSDADEQRMSETYAQILLIREQSADTAVANRSVDSVISAHGYTRHSFHDEFLRLTKNSESFRKMMDSAHNRIQRNSVK